MIRIENLHLCYHTDLVRTFGFHRQFVEAAKS
jgi:hypothetical protein